MTWLMWCLISIVSIVCYYFFSKRLFNEDENVDPRFYGGMLQLGVGILALIPVLAEGWKFVWTPTNMLWLGVVAVMYTIGPSLYYTALKHTHLSVTTTFDAVGAIYAFALGIIMLNETFNWQKLAGVVLILLGVVVVSGKISIFNKLNKYELILLISPLFYAIGAIADNTLIKSSNASTYLALSFLVAGITMTGINLPRIKKVGAVNILNPKTLKVLSINSIFIAIYGYASYRAYMLGGQVSAMYPIMQSESVVVPFMAMWLLGERDKFFHKIAGALLAFAGVWLLSWNKS